ncbi:hypothetical protein [Lactobacillus hominis]|uniref:Right handed beta helix domain-containing protein n=1 Tax=Lactobacillus hominis DSM 23910 = CRBIP 24.179 TaxID=1423758 RepID=I7KHG9_9LACO|nr:hypothetical protein [Lactobacillus hominis]KRM84838.1 hypothetical protein FC41_GL001872 [Lactobacillus hominis DSM 23910 = CRBIP 24.179]MCT3347875.1 hypothetical protein [Lactobacillus hominis]CCI82120.1 Putative uncharacterized protein [Lactobacillus hominis DSM 23910 = CRBIP 24.179]
MTRLVKVGSRGHEIEWKQALKTLKADDVLLLEPGYYQLPQGLDVTDLTIKGTGASPEDTVIESFFTLGPDCNFFTVENACIQAKAKNNAIFVEEDADTYLTLRNVVLRGNEDDTAGIAVNGRCTLELFSTKVLNASVSMFKKSNFRITMNDSLIDYPSEKYSAIGVQGKGTAIISHSQINGSISTYPGSNSELDLNNSIVKTALIHGSTWMNMLNSQILSEDDAGFYISDESWVNIVNCQFAGGIFIDKNTRTIMQNSQLDRIICCDKSKLTLINDAVISHADFQDNSVCDASRTAFSGSNEFEFFLALNKNATLSGKDLVFNPNETVMAVQDDSQVKISVLSSSSDDLDIECNNIANVDISGIKWNAKKSDK